MALAATKKGRNVRPGTGGRLPRGSSFTPTTATRELFEKYGQPTVRTIRVGKYTVSMFVWVVDGEGDGAIVARLSGRELQGGETAYGQIHPQLHLARQLGKQPRMIVVTTTNTGAHRHADRCDLKLLEQEMVAGRIRWVMWRDEDRMSRNETSFFIHRDVMRDTGTELILETLGRAVDWKRDRVQLNSGATMAVEERDRIYMRTHGAIHRNYLAEGRGWPGTLRYGIRRNPDTLMPEIDPEQWPFVEMAFYAYLETDTPGGGGVSKVRQQLEDAGCKFSKSQVLRMLRYQGYVTGEYTVKRGDHVIACAPIKLGDRAIPMHVFERVQELLRVRRGKETRNPPGTFLLNGIITHDCGAKLRARAYKDGRSGYRHEGHVCDKCRGFVLDAERIEAAVIREVLRLVNCRTLADEYAEAAQMERIPGEPILDAGEISRINHEISRLEARKSQQQQAFTQRVIDSDETLDENAYQEMVGVINAEIESRRERIRRAEALENVRANLETKRDASDDLLATMHAILTEELPEDYAERSRRAALLREFVSEVKVYGRGDDVSFTLSGALIPDDVPPLQIPHPIEQAEAALGKVRRLDAEIAEEAELAREPELVPGKVDKTDADAEGSKLVTAQANGDSNAHSVPTGSLVMPYESVGTAPPPIGTNVPRRDRRKRVPSPRSGAAGFSPSWQSRRIPLEGGFAWRSSPGYVKSMRRAAELVAVGSSFTAAARALTLEEMPMVFGSGGWSRRTVIEATRGALRWLELDDEMRDAVEAKLARPKAGGRRS